MERVHAMLAVGPQTSALIWAALEAIPDQGGTPQ